MRAIASQIMIVYSVVYSRRRSKETSKFRVTELCVGNSPETGEFPTHRASNAENVSIWWRYLTIDICHFDNTVLSPNVDIFIKQNALDTSACCVYAIMVREMIKGSLVQLGSSKHRGSISQEVFELTNLYVMKVYVYMRENVWQMII